MSSTIRKMNIRVEIDTWEWLTVNRVETLGVTQDVLNYRWQKSIKNPEGSCQISILPQRKDKHILDVIKPMDVVKIYEFGTLKFIGYIVRVSYTGTIEPQSGKPSRNATITCKQFGGLLHSSGVGFGLGFALGGDDAPRTPLVEAAKELEGTLRNNVRDGLTFSEIIKFTANAFIKYLGSIGARNILNYLRTYLDMSSGLTSRETPAVPKKYDFFTGNEQFITFWEVIDQIVERPLNEFWIDNGPRAVSIDGSNVNLPDGKACLVFRHTPFNGTVTDSGALNMFDNLPVKRIDKNLLLRFDLTRSMDEVYTFYVVKEAALALDYYKKLAIGDVSVDKNLIGKYLLRPLNVDLLHTSIVSKDGAQQETSINTVKTARGNARKTLVNWFKNNDRYLSGAISHMVPSENEKDPKIGDKLEVDGIEGHFYVEGVAHIWSYQGPLRSDLTITRGFNGNKPMELKDKIFMRNQVR